MAAIRGLEMNDLNHFQLVAIPRKDKGTELDEEKALTLSRMVCLGSDWDGEMRLSAFWEAVRGSMESNIDEFDDAELQEAGVEGAKQVLAVRESTWHADHDPKWQGVKQDKCQVNQNPKKYRVKAKDREGWWKSGAKGTPQSLTELQYVLLKQACENQAGNPDLKTDKPGGLLMLKAFAKNLEAMKNFVGKIVRWELRPTPLA